MTPHLVFLCRSAPVRMKQIRDCLFSDLRGEERKIHMLNISICLTSAYAWHAHILTICIC
ncbi:hypothetical protein C6652_23870 [Salmonella enterica]|uniref:Uncharacterized protein n=1 Tax=Salmonella enterica TaxID=28901 RepID=A0A3R0XTA2_SALER|nr:hypothetical protein [Salmonella enterica]ECT7714506.1 hypothetical protein [Salmonella enterica subsp. enterica serovar Cotham]ECU1104264.1 hypothetical protein [Salmonella enterica subsp. enterica]EDG7826948.1 hypothetical protein [Salmonella enterica subsp. enterica serovar Typhimurium]EDQ3844130.1 hypothetical protein [Salmonella enterica subsp. enterica serovar Bareilly]